MNFKECCIKRNELILQFKKIFHKEPNWDLGFLFDVVEFSEDLNIPDDIALTDYLKQHYGEDANQVIDDMIELSTDFAQAMSFSTESVNKEIHNKGLLRKHA